MSPTRKASTPRGSTPNSPPKVAPSKQPPPNSSPIGVALLGCGTVGSGVYELLTTQADALQSIVGAPPMVRHVLVRDAARPRAGVNPKVLTQSFETILDDPSTEVVVELMGGTEEAYTCIRQALLRGKHVVTANKDLMATRGAELLALAAAQGRSLFFEAAVAGGIPIIRAVRDSLAADQVTAVRGIINGTTNYIITRMSSDGLSYETALREAQQAGFAEADPKNDVEGIDAAYKLAVLASLAFKTRVAMRAVDHEGIAGLQAVDLEYARSLGYCIKLLAEARHHEGQLELLVAPCMLPLGHPLASVQGSFNAVMLETSWAGDLMFYGRGAGERPTASAVAGDLVRVLHHVRANSQEPLSQAPLLNLPVRPGPQRRSRFYLRLRVQDEPGVLASVSRILAREGISLQCVIQKGQDAPDRIDVVFMTHETDEAHMQRAVKGFANLETVHQVAALLRVRGN